MKKLILFACMALLTLSAGGALAQVKQSEDPAIATENVADDLLAAGSPADKYGSAKNSKSCLCDWAPGNHTDLQNLGGGGAAAQTGSSGVIKK
jgi:hypothetical protein